MDILPKSSKVFDHITALAGGDEEPFWPNEGETVERWQHCSHVSREHSQLGEVSAGLQCDWLRFRSLVTYKKQHIFFLVESNPVKLETNCT